MPIYKTPSMLHDYKKKVFEKIVYIPSKRIFAMCGQPKCYKLNDLDCPDAPGEEGGDVKRNADEGHEQVINELSSQVAFLDGKRK